MSVFLTLHNILVVDLDLVSAYRDIIDYVVYNISLKVVIVDCVIGKHHCRYTSSSTL